MGHTAGVGTLVPEIILRHGTREYRVDNRKDAIVVDGVAVEVPVRAIVAADADSRWVFLDGHVWEFVVESPGRKRKAASHDATLTAPMPSTVRKIVVEPGATVKKGDTLLVLEAMKMELPVRAPSDGVVKAISCREGELVQPGVPLVEMA